MGTPQGIVAILVGKDGREIATATDFNHGAPGGFSQKEAQQIRAKKHLAFTTIRNLSSPILADAIDDYSAEQIIGKMCEKGCRLVIVPVGYDG